MKYIYFNYCRLNEQKKTLSSIEKENTDLYYSARYKYKELLKKLKNKIIKKYIKIYITIV